MSIRHLSFERGRPAPTLMVGLVVFLAAMAWPVGAQDLLLELEERPKVMGGGYVGSETCGGCHKNQYRNYVDRSAKSRSYEAIERMKDGLTEQEIENCYRCHTTGYGVETGFVDKDTTPTLMNVGCEACHGPGKLHSEKMDMKYIVKTVTIDVCEKCHKSDLVKSFRYKGLIYAGAH